MSERSIGSAISGSGQSRPERLSLYHFEGCPYCNRVRRAALRLGTALELRDIHQNPHFRAELVEARGRPSVPVLRVEALGESSRWLPESEEIVAWLYERAGVPPENEAQRLWARLPPWLPWLAIGAGLLFQAGRPWLIGGGVGLLLLNLARRAPRPGSQRSAS